MNLKYSGSEKGLKLTPIGIDHYADLLKNTALSLSSEEKPDPDKLVFPISDKRSILEEPPRAHISIDNIALSALCAKQLYFALMIKEPSSRSCRVVLNDTLTDELAQATIPLSYDDFSDLAFGSSVFIDILVYEKTGNQGPLIQGFKRFSLSFSAIAGLWSIESVEPHFFVNRGGGLNTMFLTEMDFDGESDLKRDS